MREYTRGKIWEKSEEGRMDKWKYAREEDWEKNKRISDGKNEWRTERKEGRMNEWNIPW